MACIVPEQEWVLYDDDTLLVTQAKAATKQADAPSATAADTAVSAAQATAPEPAQISAQAGLADPDESITAEPKQSKAEKSTKKSKRKAEAATVGSGAPEAEPKAGKTKKKAKHDAQHESITNGHSAEAPQTASPAVADSTGPHANGDSSEPQRLKLKKQKKQQAAEAAVPEAEDTPIAAETPGKRGLSWAKLAKEILAGCEGHRMKLAKLQQKVVAAAGLPKQAVADHEEAIMQKLSSKSKSFALTDGEVLLKVA